MKVNYIVLMSWDEGNHTKMSWGRGETLQDIEDGMSFFQNKPNFEYEIYEVSKKIKNI